MVQHACCSPAKAVDKEPHGEGSDHAPNREDSDGEGPERGEGGRADGLTVPVQPGTVVEVLNHLRKMGEKQSRGFNKPPSFHLGHQCYKLPGPMAHRTMRHGAAGLVAQLQPREETCWDAPGKCSQTGSGHTESSSALPKYLMRLPGQPWGGHAPPRGTGGWRDNPVPSGETTQGEMAETLEEAEEDGGVSPGGGRHQFPPPRHSLELNF